MKRLLKRFWSKDFLLYAILGCVNTLNASFFSTVLAWLLHDNAAATLGYLLSLMLAYPINSRFVFRMPLSWRRFRHFMLCYIPHFVIYTGMCFVTINWLSLPQFAATALPIMLAGPITFLLLKKTTFDQEKKKESKK